MGIVGSKTCVCDYERDGCQDINDVWNWGWRGTQFFLDRPGVSIDTVTWTFPAELTKVTEITAGTTFYAQVANNTGTAEETYAIYALMVTTDGEEVNFRINITLTDITADG